MTAKTAPPRPHITHAILLEAARKSAVRTKFDPEHIADCYSTRDDGYELAKKLEDYGYSISVSDVEELDEMRYAVADIHEKACWEWVKENNIQAPYPVGTELTRGVIAGISEHSPASYQVKEYDCAQEGRFRIIRFEDAVLRDSGS